MDASQPNTSETHPVDPDEAMRALEAVRRVAEQHAIPSRDLKTCIAYLLDGNLTGSSRKAAFTLAIELRRLDWEQRD